VGDIDRYFYLGWNPLPRVERLRIAGAPRFLRGLRVLFAADFHIRDGTRDSYLDELARMIGSADADLFLLGGDYGESADAARRLFRALDGLSFHYGAYAVIGNNDREVFPEIAQLQQMANMPILVNEAVSVDIGGGRLIIGGVDEMEYGAPNARGMFDGRGEKAYAILLTHYPYVHETGGAQADIILSGHTHGGQINVFGLTAYALGFEQRQVQGVAGCMTRGGAKMLVTTGIGMSKLPIRVGCAPRIHVLEFL
jgi:predicted MPP superfamily phosphohydrolase